MNYDFKRNWTDLLPREFTKHGPIKLDANERFMLTKHLKHSIEVDNYGQGIDMRDVYDIENILNQNKVTYQSIDFKIIIGSCDDDSMDDHLHILVYGDSYIAFQYSMKIKNAIRSMKHQRAKIINFKNPKTAVSYLHHCNREEHVLVE